MAKSGGERFLNWDDFNRACIERGMPPEIFATLKRAYRTFCQGGTDLTTLRWFFTRWASWAKVIPVGVDKTLDSQTNNSNRTSPLILYPSTLLQQGFCCEKKFNSRKNTDHWNEQTFQWLDCMVQCTYSNLLPMYCKLFDKILKINTRK